MGEGWVLWFVGGNAGLEDLASKLAHLMVL